MGHNFFPLLWSLGLPNWITVGRLGLAVLLFVILSLPVPWGYDAGFWIFVIATGSDWVDGFLARRFQMVTVLGRILDPFVDKILICGTLIFLAADPRMHSHLELLQPWMVVVVLARELLVTALRSWVEERGQDFSAQTAGKLKMVVQSVAGAAGLMFLAVGAEIAHPWVWLYWVLVVSVWAMVAVTVYSGVVYVWPMVRLVKALCSTG
jgi:CDP-diacylglycerol--glycerol-3-phosphate 3-phosphatidyltransferase